MRLFGQTYSGLEYDYRGLLHVYEELHDNENYVRFCDVLDEWRIMRSDEKRVSWKRTNNCANNNCLTSRNQHTSSWRRTQQSKMSRVNSSKCVSTHKGFRCLQFIVRWKNKSENVMMTLVMKSRRKERKKKKKIAEILITA